MITVFYICLFIPFIILFAVFGATFMTAGYKKDLGRSLISLGASVTAIIISFVMSKLFAWGLSFVINKALTKAISNDNAMMSGLVEGMTQGVIKILLALFFFGIFFAVTMGVFKTVFKNHIHVDKLNLGTAGSKWGGLGVRFVDTLLVVLMLSLPLYGTLATVVPPVSSIIQFATADDNETDAVMPTASARRDTMGVAFMDTTAAAVPDGELMPQKSDSQDVVTVIKLVENHPVLIPYKYGPADWVYSGLSSFSMNGKSVDVSRAAEVMGGLVDRFIAFTEVIGSEDEDLVIAATEKIVSYARDNVVEERWFYNMCMALLSEFDKAIAEHSTEIGEDMAVINRLRPLFDMSYKEFKSNGVALLDFLEYFLRQETVVMFKSQQNDLTYEQTMEKEDEFLARLGELINHSEQAVSAKQLIYMTSFSRKFSMQNTDALFNNWGDGMLSDTEDQKRDAYLFFELTVGAGTFDIMQLVAMHPLFKSEGAMLLMQSDGVVEQLEWEFDSEVSRHDIEALIKNDESFKASVKQKLVSYEQVAIVDVALLLGDNDLFNYVKELIADKLGIDISGDFHYDGDHSFSAIGGADESTLIVVRPKF